MPATWPGVLADLMRLGAEDQAHPPQPGQPARGDQYRRSKIAAIEAITGRPLVIYASARTSPGKSGLGEMLMLDFSDKIGFKTVTDSIAPPNLDILVHSPGGLAEAAESLVQEVRGKYTSVRFIVPSFAKSAATMFVMSGDEILMDKDAELGPIDPQMRTQNGFSPAEAILEQFKKAQQELQNDATKLPSWLPILSQLGPSLIVDCQHAIALSSELVKTWTKEYMFRGDPAAEVKSKGISEFLGKHSQFKSHSRAVKIPDLIAHHVKVTDVSTIPELSRAIGELYCCLDIVFGNSPVYKIFENRAGDALIRQAGLAPMQMVPGVPRP